MSSRTYRAWRFRIPDIDTPEEEAGFGISHTGGIDMVDEHESVRQSILLLMSHTRGERVMRPEYGCDLHKLVFAPNDDTTAGLAIHYTRQALERWEPRIDILRLDAGSNEDDPSRLDIMLEYKVRATQLNEQLTYSINLSGEEA
ncbi:MAG: GPW/gp25 family protein [Nitrospiraceae bacterium]|nr:MAG: GPW/gp25 family protein [Nitrospiraceae bacterium]